jgi:hypothetical protein
VKDHTGRRSDRFVVLAQVQCRGQHGVVCDGGAADGSAAFSGGFVAFQSGGVVGVLEYGRNGPRG